MSLLLQFTLLLSVALVLSNLAQQLHFPKFLAFIITGMLFGQAGFGLIDVQGDWQGISLWLSIAFALYLGFQLKPQKLWDARKKVFGLASLMVIGSSAILAVLSTVFLKTAWPSSLLIALAFSFASNHLVLGLLEKQQQTASSLGQDCLALSMLHGALLIPSLMLLQLIQGADTPYHILAYVMLVIALMSALLLFGRYVLQPLLRRVANQPATAFVATALAVVCVVMVIAESFGIHLVLAAFLAGMLFADSEYRLQLAEQLKPFTHLIVALFFILLGAHFYWPQSHEFVLIMGAVFTLLMIKLLLSCAIGQALNWPWSHRLKLGLLLAHAGEFSFILLLVAQSEQIINQPVFNLLLAVLLLSYSISSIALPLLQQHLFKKPQIPSRSDAPEATLVIAGFGRVGQLLARIAHLQQHSFVAIDNSIGDASFVQHYGGQLIYADATDAKVLAQAGLGTAQLFILAVDDIEDSLHIARYVRMHYPQLNILARARDRHHVHLLNDLGIYAIWRESYVSSLEMAYHMLCDLGSNQQHAKTQIQQFRRHDEALLQAQQHLNHADLSHDAHHQNSLAELQHLFAEDAKCLDEFVLPTAKAAQD